jgi:hypothetical protein
MGHDPINSNGHEQQGTQRLPAQPLRVEPNWDFLAQKAQSSDLQLPGVERRIAGSEGRAELRSLANVHYRHQG